MACLREQFLSTGKETIVTQRVSGDLAGGAVVLIKGTAVVGLWFMGTLIVVVALIGSKGRLS